MWSETQVEYMLGGDVCGVKQVFTNNLSICILLKYNKVTIKVFSNNFAFPVITS